jgi:hypothetical protein
MLPQNHIALWLIVSEIGPPTAVGKRKDPTDNKGAEPILRRDIIVSSEKQF